MLHCKPVAAAAAAAAATTTARVCGVGANQSFSTQSLLRKSIRGLSAGKLETVRTHEPSARNQPAVSNQQPATSDQRPSNRPSKPALLPHRGPPSIRSIRALGHTKDA